MINKNDLFHYENIFKNKNINIINKIKEKKKNFDESNISNIDVVHENKESSSLLGNSNCENSVANPIIENGCNKENEIGQQNEKYENYTKSNIQVTNSNHMNNKFINENRKNNKDLTQENSNEYKCTKSLENSTDTCNENLGIKKSNTKDKLYHFKSKKKNDLSSLFDDSPNKSINKEENITCNENINFVFFDNENNELKKENYEIIQNEKCSEVYNMDKKQFMNNNLYDVTYNESISKYNNDNNTLDENVNINNSIPASKKIEEEGRSLLNYFNDVSHENNVYGKNDIFYNNNNENIFVINNKSEWEGHIVNNIKMEYSENESVPKNNLNTQLMNDNNNISIYSYNSNYANKKVSKEDITNKHVDNSKLEYLNNEVNNVNETNYTNNETITMLNEVNVSTRVNNINNEFNNIISDSSYENNVFNNMNNEDNYANNIINNTNNGHNYTGNELNNINSEIKYSNEEVNINSEINTGNSKFIYANNGINKIGSELNYTNNECNDINNETNNINNKFDHTNEIYDSNNKLPIKNEKEDMNIPNNKEIIYMNDKNDINTDIDKKNFLKNPIILFDDNGKLDIKDNYIEKIFKEQKDNDNTENKKVDNDDDVNSNNNIIKRKNIYNNFKDEDAIKENKMIVPNNTYGSSEHNYICFCFGNNGLFFYSKKSIMKSQYLINIVEKKVKEKKVNKESNIDEYIYCLKNFPGPFSRKSNKIDEKIKSFLNGHINFNKLKYEANIFEYTQKNCLYMHLLNIINKPYLLNFNLQNIKCEKNDLKNNTKKKKIISYFIDNYHDKNNKNEDTDSSDNSDNTLNKKEIEHFQINDYGEAKNNERNRDTLIKKIKEGTEDEDKSDSYTEIYYNSINNIYINNYRYEFFDFINKEFIEELHKLENNEKITIEDNYLEYFHLCIYNSKKATQLCLQKELYKYFFLILKKYNKKKYYRMLDRYIGYINSSSLNEIEMKNDLNNIYKIYNYNIYDDVFRESFVFFMCLLNNKNIIFKKNILINYWYSYYTLIFHNFIFQFKENEINYMDYKEDIINFFIYLINLLYENNKTKESQFLLLLLSSSPFSFDLENEKLNKKIKFSNTLLGSSSNYSYFDIFSFQVSDIYEYLCRHMKDNFFYEHLIFFKILYTYTLLEWGVLGQAKQYVEILYYYMDVIKSQKKNSYLVYLYETLLDKTKYLFSQKNNLISEQNQIHNDSIYNFKVISSYTSSKENKDICTNESTKIYNTETNYNMEDNKNHYIYIDKKKNDFLNYSNKQNNIVNKTENKTVNETETGAENEIKNIIDFKAHNYANNDFENGYACFIKNENKIPVHNYNLIYKKEDTASMVHNNLYISTDNKCNAHYCNNPENISHSLLLNNNTYIEKNENNPYVNGIELNSENINQCDISTEKRLQDNSMEKNYLHSQNVHIQNVQLITHNSNYVSSDKDMNNGCIKYDKNFLVTQNENNLNGNALNKVIETPNNFINEEKQKYHWNNTELNKEENNNFSSNNNNFISNDNNFISNDNNFISNDNNFRSNDNFISNNYNNIIKNQSANNNLHDNSYNQACKNNDAFSINKEEYNEDCLNNKKNDIDNMKINDTNKNLSNPNNVPQKTRHEESNENNIDIINLGKILISGFFYNIKEKIKKTEDVQEENIFYYDYEKKRWREKGVTSDEEKEREKEKLKREMEIKNVAPPPLAANFENRNKNPLNITDVRSRYVDYFN